VRLTRARLGTTAVSLFWFVVACGAGPVTAPDPADEPTPVVDLFEEPVPDAPDPADRAGAADHYIECVHGIWNGGWSEDFGPPGSADDQGEALALFLDGGLFGLPPDGYAAAGRDDGRVLYTYTVDGVPKVAVILSDSLVGWEVETFASCDPAEYDPSHDAQLRMGIWTAADGNRTPTSIITSLRGAEHCGWESVTYLLYQERQYISDPNGVMDVEFVVPFDADTELPSDAVDTGYRREGRSFWLSADDSVAYLVSEDRVEAWPTPDSPDPVWCD
jgi:hypothetical protein